MLFQLSGNKILKRKILFYDLVKLNFNMYEWMSVYYILKIVIVECWMNSDSMIPLDLIRMWSERVCKFDYNQTKHWTAVCHPAPDQSSQSTENSFSKLFTIQTIQLPRSLLLAQTLEIELIFCELDSQVLSPVSLCL